MTELYPQVENLADPYQRDVTGMCDEFFRIHNAGVMARAACLTCDGSIPESHDFNWKFVAAGGCMEGPFCSPDCMWSWLGWR